MVKNELSLHASQQYDVLVKMAEHKISKAKNKMTEDILSIEKLVNVKPNTAALKLFNRRKEMLSINIDALFSDNQEEAKLSVLKNNSLFQRENWQYEKIDRNELDKDKVRKILAYSRHATTIYDINLEKQEFLVKKARREFDEYINHRLRLHKEIASFVENQNLQLSKPYDKFIEDTKKEHESLIANTKNNLAPFINKVMEQIDDSYSKTNSLELRNQILKLRSEIIKDYNEIFNLTSKLENDNVDLQILSIQEKEELDVKDEKRELQSSIGQTNNLILNLNNKISNNIATLQKLVYEFDTTKSKLHEATVKVDDANKQSIIDKIAVCFTYPDNEVFNRIYHLIKDYVLNLCPFTNDYILAKEKEYLLENKSFFDKYEELLKNSKKDNKDLSKDNTNHKERIASIKQNKKDGLSKISNDLAFRKQEYKEHKKAAKIALKTADGSKASEIREVLKVYKKSIRTGVFKARFNVYKHYIKALIHEFFYNLKEKKNQSLPTPLVEENNYKEIKKATKKELKHEYHVLSKALTKDFKTSRYRKNFTNTARENVLGYLFLSIWAIGFLIFTFWPIIYTFILSFTNVSFSAGAYTKIVTFSFKEGLKFPTWVWFSNFRVLFLSNVDFSFTYVPQFFRSLLFYVPIVVFISFVLAMLLNSKIKGRTLFRIIYFLPVVIVSGPVLTLLDASNTSGNSSIRLTLAGTGIARVLESLSPKALTLANEVFQNFIVILWMTGVPIVLFISALQKINKQLYEAAEIDGANKWQMLWTITFPLIKSILLIVCMFTILQVTTISVSFVNPINWWLENKLNQSGVNLGLVSLASWVQTIIVLLFVLVSFLLFREKEYVSRDKSYEEIEEIKRKRALRRAKRRERLHTTEIKLFFEKLTTPIRTAKAKRKQKEEMGG